MSQPNPRLERLWSALARPRTSWWIIGLAMLLLTPSLGTGLCLDDWVLAVKSRIESPVAGLPSDPLWLFTFTTGNPAMNQKLIDEGVLLPWWSDPHHLIALFRPLTCLTHVLDFRAWPSLPSLMHLHSMLWYALVLLVLARAYRELELEPRLIGLALLIFAWDDAHGMTVGWIANRNALTAIGLALPALITHHRAASGSRIAAWLGPLWFALGLCAGETAVCVAGYIVAYALCLDRRRPLQRALSLAPYVGLLIAHRAAYHALHLGSFGSSEYHDPLRQPIEFALALGYNLPVLLSAELLLPLADLGYWGAPAVRTGVWFWSVFCVAACGIAFIDPVRRDPRARFWLVGLCLAAIPASASVIGERLLLPLGIGACPLIARLLTAAADAWPARGATRPGIRISWPLAAALALIHGFVEPLSMPVKAAGFAPVGSLIHRMAGGIPTTGDVRDKTVIVVNAPIAILLSYTQAERAELGTPRPAQLVMLSSSSSELSVSETGPSRLRLELAEGFLYRHEETHYRADKLANTDHVSMHGIDFDVVARTADDRPKVVDATFVEPLTSPRYLFRKYVDGRLEPWQPPAAGQIDRFPAYDFFGLMFEEGLR